MSFSLGSVGWTGEEGVVGAGSLMRQSGGLSVGKGKAILRNIAKKG